MRKACIGLLVAMLFVSGCVRQTPALVGTPTPEFTPTPTPSPEPELVLLPTDTDTDAMGQHISTDEHFLQYLSFNNFRVYEYSGDTFLDAICSSDYPTPLTGAFEISFMESDGTQLARAAISIRSESGLLLPGENILYAEIDTDMDIQLLPFEIIITQRVWPMAQAAVPE